MGSFIFRDRYMSYYGRKENYSRTKVSEKASGIVKMVSSNGRIRGNSTS